MTNERIDDRITVEAEYTLPYSADPVIHRWPFEEVSPQEAKDKVVRDYVPLEATLWRVSLWYGSPEDRPDGGHQDGILTSEEDKTCTLTDENHTLDQF